MVNLVSCDYFLVFSLYSSAYFVTLAHASFLRTNAVFVRPPKQINLVASVSDTRGLVIKLLLVRDSERLRLKEESKTVGPRTQGDQGTYLY